MIKLEFAEKKNCFKYVPLLLKSKRLHPLNVICITYISIVSLLLLKNLKLGCPWFKTATDSNLFIHKLEHKKLYIYTDDSALRITDSISIKTSSTSRSTSLSSIWTFFHAATTFTSSPTSIAASASIRHTSTPARVTRIRSVSSSVPSTPASSTIEPILPIFLVLIVPIVVLVIPVVFTLIVIVPVIAIATWRPVVVVAVIVVPVPVSVVARIGTEITEVPLPEAGTERFVAAY